MVEITYFGLLDAGAPLLLAFVTTLQTRCTSNGGQGEQTHSGIIALHVAT
jgi:hypothetical protein